MHFVLRVTGSPPIVTSSVSPIARDKSGFADSIRSQRREWSCSRKMRSTADGIARGIPHAGDLLYH